MLPQQNVEMIAELVNWLRRSLTNRRSLRRTNNDIREEFLAFIGLDRITGAEIADAIIKFLQDNDVPVANMRGLGYNALELIGYRRHLNKYGDKYADWDTVNRTEAQQILASITSFAFIVSFTCVLQHMKVRGRMWTSISKMPRVTGRQQHRSNPSSFSVEDYFKKTVAIPLFDHIVTSMKDRFFAAAIVASFLLGVIPSVCCSREVSMERAIEKYKDDLPSPELTSTELRRRKARMSVELRPSTPAAAIKDCDSDLYPNVKVLLQIACTLPVTSCECFKDAMLQKLRQQMPDDSPGICLHCPTRWSLVDGQS
eukprot:Em0011g478a